MSNDSTDGFERKNYSYNSIDEGDFDSNITIWIQRRVIDHQHDHAAEDENVNDVLEPIVKCPIDEETLSLQGLEGSEHLSR